MLKVWGRDNSVNVQKVLWCCEELGLPFERRDAGLQYGVVNTPEYRAMNPNGLVPTVEDGPLVLWESNAIVRYLAAKHGQGTLWPANLDTRAQGDMWMDWMVSTFWPTFRALFWNLIRTPPAERNAKETAESLEKTGEILTYLDSHLHDRRYIAGDAFSIGDIPMGCAIWRWFALPIERRALPNVQRWFDLLGTRPAYAKVVMQPLS